LDTRLKIVSYEAARRDIKKVVVGYFDPLYADNVDRLTHISEGDPITIVVADRSDTLLPLRARGELVAALSCVEQVILGDGDLSQVLSNLGAARFFDEREADERRTRELSAHIVDRYRPQ
jgi:hypothetical protein